MTPGTRPRASNFHGLSAVCCVVLCFEQVMSLDSTGSHVVGSNVKMVGRTITGVKTVRMATRSGSTGERLRWCAHAVHCCIVPYVLCCKIPQSLPPASCSFAYQAQLRYTCIPIMHRAFGEAALWVAWMIIVMTCSCTRTIIVVTSSIIIRSGGNQQSLCLARNAST